ncbi:MAG TPA: hypothetical protein VGQ76_27180 [Thermoanaerobaculia bacterium]|nr:hypothetical protein [Thermoanaerobaculia bacterium]
MLLLLRRPRSTSRLLLLLLLRTLSVALALLRTFRSATATFFVAARLARACALLVLADLLLHETARLLVEFRAKLVVTAVGAALPSFGIGSFATGAEDGFREWHR